MEIIYKKISELIPYENNPRINDHAVEAVANSIKEFGFKNPIYFTDKNNVNRRREKHSRRQRKRFSIQKAVNR